MIESSSRLITLKEFLTLPETKPASEYIDGQVIQKPMPQGKHSTIQTKFSTTINVALKPQKIARAFSELRCTFGDRSSSCPSPELDCPSSLTIRVQRG